MNQEFKFPDEIENSQESEGNTPEIEIEVIDDTPEYDQKRDPMPKERFGTMSAEPKKLLYVSRKRP